MSDSDDFGDFDAQHDDFDDFHTFDNQPTLVDIILRESTNLFTQNSYTKTTQHMLSTLFSELPPPPPQQQQQTYAQPTKHTILRAVNVSNLAVTKQNSEKVGNDRLLRNLVWMIVGVNLPEAANHFMLESRESLISRYRVDKTDKEEEEVERLTVGEIKELVGNANISEAMLRRAIADIDVAVAEKQHEVEKRSEEIDTYNQVIQKLVAQASKLH